MKEGENKEDQEEEGEVEDQGENKEEEGRRIRKRGRRRRRRGEGGAGGGGEEGAYYDIYAHTMCLLSSLRPRQLSRDVQRDTDFLWDGAAVFWDPV